MYDSGNHFEYEYVFKMFMEILGNVWKIFGHVSTKRWQTEAINHSQSLSLASSIGKWVFLPNATAWH